MNISILKNPSSKSFNLPAMHRLGGKVLGKLNWKCLEYLWLQKVKAFL